MTCDVRTGMMLTSFCSCGHLVAVHQQDQSCSLCALATEGCEVCRAQIKPVDMPDHRDWHTTNTNLPRAEQMARETRIR